MHRNQQSESRKVNSQRNMFQIKEQDTTSAGVIARLWSDGHKDDQRTWGKEWMGIVRISTTKIGNILKYQLKVIELKNNITELKNTQNTLYMISIRETWKRRKTNLGC